MAAILHMVLFKFPSIEGAVPQELAAVIAKFNELSGISAQFYPYGVGVEGLATKAAFLEAVAWPDKADGYTHCLIVLATGAPALKAYLHSDEHIKMWMPAVKPYIKGILVFDTKLDFHPDQMAQSGIQHVVFFKFPAIEGAVPPELDSVVTDGFNDLPGVSAQFFPFGVGIDGAASGKAFREAVAWPDKADGFTHCLFVVVRDTADLKGYLHSDEHLKMWMPAVKPYIKGIIVFDTFLERDLVPRCTAGYVPRSEDAGLSQGGGGGGGGADPRAAASPGTTAAAVSKPVRAAAAASDDATAEIPHSSM